MWGGECVVKRVVRGFPDDSHIQFDSGLRQSTFGLTQSWKGTLAISCGFRRTPDLSEGSILSEVSILSSVEPIAKTRVRQPS
jgi:hypothetical protein